MLQILHLSDLHLFRKDSLHRDLQYFLSRVAQLPGPGFLGHLYSYSYHPAEGALADALLTVGGQYHPTIIALTGDIAALPYDSTSDIDRVYYPYVSSLIPPDPNFITMLALLGNHDWQISHNTNFQGSQFDGPPLDALTHPRAAVVPVPGLTVVVFMLSSTDAILPATGMVQNIAGLRQLFNRGKAGQLTRPDGTSLSSGEYSQAVKVVLLHHFPLPHAGYGGALSWAAYLPLKLHNRQELINACIGEVDMFLFGHSHQPLQRTWKRMVMIDCGSTLVTETGNSPSNAQFQLIRILGQRDIEVIPHRWASSHSTFIPMSRHSFRRSTWGDWF